LMTAKHKHICILAYSAALRSEHYGSNIRKFKSVITHTHHSHKITSQLHPLPVLTTYKWFVSIQKNFFNANGQLKKLLTPDISSKLDNVRNTEGL